MPLVRVTSAALLTPGTLAQVDAGGRTVAICNNGGRIHALHGLCPHRNGPLGQGNLSDGHVICPWHAWAFECESGQYDFNPDIRVETYAVVDQDGEVFVDIPE